MISRLIAVVLSLMTPHSQTVHLSDYSLTKSRSVIVHIKIYEKNGGNDVRYGMVGCSGTFISPDEVLTAAHCFSDPSTRIWVRAYQEKSVEARLKKVDVKHDLALLVVKGANHVHASLGPQPKFGDSIYTMGNPYPYEFALSLGRVVIIGQHIRSYWMEDPVGQDATYTVSTAQIDHGSSGGGLFNTKDELIGVNTMSYSMLGWNIFAESVDMDTIREFLKPSKKAPSITIIIGNA